MVKQKILVGGRIDTVMIEASNLITKSETSILGFIKNNSNGEMPMKIVQNPDSTIKTLSLLGIASTLVVSKCEYNGKYLGSLKDCEMLRFTGANIDNDNITITVNDISAVV